MNRIALITGATSGIGEACAEIFAQNGYSLILTGRRQNRLEQLAEHLSSDYKVTIKTMAFDVRNQAEVSKNLGSLDERWRNIGVLINNAGLASGLNTIDEGNIDDWELMIDTNVKGLLYVSRIVLPWMKERQQGHVINIGSIAGKETYKNGNVYCATKHAVDSLTKAMRIDMLPHKIRVTGICPGAAETEFSLVRYKGDAEKAKNVYKGFEPLVAKDIAEVIWFAASRPAHVNLNDIVITPIAQANTFYIEKENV